VTSVDAKPLVVIADDNESLRFLLTEVVHDHAASSSFEVVESEAALPALAAVATGARSGRRMLVISDNRMPGMTGTELIRRARTDHPNADLKLFVISSAELPTNVRDELASMGARSLTRPFHLKELRVAVGSILDEWMRA